MLRISRKSIAILLALWLPLFSGSALAASVAMQARGGHCTPAVQSVERHSDHAKHDMHVGHDMMLSHDADQSAQHDAPCNNCGVCHIACCGYLAAVLAGVSELPATAQSYTIALTGFQSITSAPLDPPPLARV